MFCLDTQIIRYKQLTDKFWKELDLNGEGYKQGDYLLVPCIIKSSYLALNSQVKVEQKEKVFKLLFKNFPTSIGKINDYILMDDRVKIISEKQFMSRYKELNNV